MVTQVQRVAAYAVIVRDGQILLSRLAPRVSRTELWTLPGGGLDHGEDPRDAVVREVHEETGLDVTIGDTARTFSLHLPDTWRRGRRVDAHSLRIVYEGWVALDAPEPRVLEVDGSTIEAAWRPLAGVLDGTIPTVSLVKEALAAHRPRRVQRVAAYAWVRRAEPEDAVLLTRISARGHHVGSWTLPGGGIDHGERPQVALAREVAEECGLDCTVGDVLAVDDVTIRGNGPTGRDEDFHGVHLVFAAEVADGEPHVVDVDGTTDAAAWVPVADIEAGRVDVLDVVRTALAAG
ncbi:NUDIX domain-containing protein [Nocardioides dongxiaopingii]|uniref:NUDIX domain-containing protein n=1 Tax=Nocardioides sp. S-1144 TaxID=2582905 RepID=UPI00110EDDE7|nr:NUDIX domain-containing protein [Nocardioides sp. S-1144]QCW51666.1 NUDIX domain-containing protein [Nocardioides sp. S-1144]